MTANVNPLFVKTPNAGAMNAILSTAMTNTKAYDGTEAVGTAMALVFTGGADAALIEKISIRYSSINGATASGTTTATVIRFWLNNGSANTTATNNKQIGSITIPAATVTALASSAMPEIVLPSDMIKSVPAGYRIYAGMTVAIGGTNCAALVSVEGGDF